MALTLHSDRIVGLMTAKSLQRKHFLGAGFKASQYGNWVYRRGRSRQKQPTGPDAVALALWLEVPSEYLFGASTEYDDLPFWEVAARASLDHFLRRTVRGREVAHFRPLFEAYIGTDTRHAPMTAEQWASAAHLVLLTRSHHTHETRQLDLLIENVPALSAR